MARSHYWQYLINEEGQPVENAVISVYESGTETCVNIYKNKDDSEVIQSPDTEELLTNSNGLFEFWIGNFDLPVDDNAYNSDQLFKITWYKAGTGDASGVNGEIDDVRIIYESSESTCYGGSSTFNGTTGTTISIGATLTGVNYSVAITPTANSEEVGSIYVTTKTTSTFKVHCTGDGITTFDWIILDLN